MPAAKKKPATAERISPLENGSAHFAFQVGRIEGGFQWAMRRALEQVQRDILTDVYTLPIAGAAGIRPFAENIAASVSRKMELLEPQLVAALETFAMAAAEALPKFLNNATGAVDPLIGPNATTGQSAEQFQDDATDRIDSIFDTSFPKRGGDPSSRDDAENEEEEEEEDFWWFWVPMPPQDALRIVALLVWQQYSIQQLWEGQIERQRRQVLQRLLSELSLIAIDSPDQAMPEGLIRKTAAAVISRNIAPSNRVGSPRAPGNAVDAVSRVVSTAVWAIANEVMNQTIASNATAPGNAAAFGSAGAGSSTGLRSTIGGKTRRVGVYWSCTFDGHNICFKCAALHGTFFPHDANGDTTSPPCPLHFDCRCFRVPGFDSAKNRKREAKAIGQFNRWFGQQSEEFQKGMMGPKRFELWQSGDFTFRDFVEFRNGVPVDIRTLRELGDLFRI